MTRALRNDVSTFLSVGGGSFNLPNPGNPGNNPGLALSRYLAVQSRADHDARDHLFSQIADHGEPSTHYRRAYSRWEATTKALPNMKQQRFRVQGRMIVGKGAESVLESSIALNQPWGMPYIPGSALKGLAAHYLEGVQANGDANFKRAPEPDPDDERKRIPPNAHGVLFGTTRGAAYITWHDAWLIPGTAESQHPFCRDVITTHHPNYYRENTALGEPTDFDDPIPNSFLSARGDYLICLQGPTEEWTTFALKVLTEALANAGIGAKTSSGYGRLTPVPTS